jgi:DNA (cytosine-5)-methyltransferase 1
MERRLISLFSGAGGMDIGFHKAGFKTAVAVEQDPSCCDTLRLNMPNTPILEGDIRSMTTSTILSAAKAKPLEIDLVIGGPPCQSFSLAGKRMGMDDPRGLLVLEFLRVVREALPKCFVMENVKGMIHWSNGKALEAIMTEAEMATRTKALRWQNKEASYRSLILNINVPQVKKNIDIVLLDDKIDEVKAPSLANTLGNNKKYLAIGELKGGIDPAGADEHWKTANTALERVRKSFSKTLDLFFIGAAIEAEMSKEIYRQLKSRELSNAANLKFDEQLSALCKWLIEK